MLKQAGSHRPRHAKAHLAAWLAAGITLFGTCNLTYYLVGTGLLARSWVGNSLLVSLHQFVMLLIGLLVITGMVHVTAGFSSLFMLRAMRTGSLWWCIIVPLISVDIWALPCGVVVDLDPENFWPPGGLRNEIAHALFTPTHLLLYSPPTIAWGYAWWHFAVRSDTRI